MPRTLAAGFDAQLTATVTDPGHLIYLGFSPARYYATKATVTTLSQTWQIGSGIKIDFVNHLEARFSMRNTDASVTSMVAGVVLADIPCQIYSIYASFTALLFDGFLDGSPDLAEDEVLFEARAASFSKYAPAERIAPPVFNHLMPAGFEIRWGSDVVLVVEEDS